VKLEEKGKGMEEQVISPLTESKIICRRGDSPKRAMLTAAKLQCTSVQVQKQRCLFLCNCSEQKAVTMLIDTLPPMHI